jgi:hypothetical protein
MVAKVGNQKYYVFGRTFRVHLAKNQNFQVETQPLFDQKI